jgi:hypothetical protein
MRRFTGLLKELVAITLAMGIAAGIGVGVAYLIIATPIWIYGNDTMLLWGWVGIPLGGIVGFTLFLFVASWLGRKFVVFVRHL